MGGGGKVSVDDNFNISGPLHLVTIDWNRPDHEYSAITCLVQATYVLENDRKRSQESLASAWWLNVGFELFETFIDDKDTSIFGAIYRNARYNDQTPQAPRFVIAFRGTILEAANIRSDLSHDLLVGDGGLGSTARLKKSMMYIECHTSELGTEGIFLAGHSLGSSMAMLAGANMATKGIYLKTFLFNLPSCLTDEETSKRLIARFLQITPWIVGLAGAVGMFPLAAIASMGMAVSLVTVNTLVAAYSIASLASLTALAGASVLSLKKKRARQELPSFAPYIFVNPEDPVCKNWIAYFRNQSKKTNKKTQLKFASFLESAVIKINSNPGQGRLEAHNLKQWWQQGIKLLDLEEFGSQEVSIRRL